MISFCDFLSQVQPTLDITFLKHGKVAVALISRMLRFLPRAWRNRPRLIRLRDDTVLQYRLNRGDLWSLRESWIFEASESSNMGSLQAQGTTKVRLVSMATVLGTLGAGEKIDLLKIDIEGGEQELLMGELSWLDRVRAIIIEFHPEYVDYPLLCERIVACGFTYIPGGSSFPDSMDAFVRATVDTAIISEDANANS